jgi:hypothetical protein
MTLIDAGWSAPSDVSPADASSVEAEPSSQEIEGGGAARVAASPRPPALGEVLFGRVSLGGSEPPLYSLVLIACVVISIGAGVLGLTIGLALSSAQEFAEEAGALPVASSPPLARSESPPASPLRPVVSLLDRARTGDESALGMIAQKAPGEATAEEALALTEGEAERERRRARELRQRVTSDPTIVKNPEVIKELLRLARSDETAADALGAIAALPGPISADLAYEVWTGTTERNRATRLAQTIVYSPDVFPKASPALRIALDLRRTDDCEQNREIVRRAITDGDRRSLHLLGKLQRRFGCGKNKREDCFKCLREGTDLKDAAREVAQRPAPKL